MRSPFPDQSFDVVLTNEVLEHVPDLSAALRDTVRILRPGGKLIGTFPFNWAAFTTDIRARLNADGIEHLRPPEYHGNPVDPEGGSLVFQIPGWDILELCKAAGFSDACMVFTGSTRLGITSREIPGVFVIEATR
jgi:SAM-dependent methyltransferase